MTSLVIVDPHVSDYEQLLAGLDPDTEVLILEGTGDGPLDIAAYLKLQTDIDALLNLSYLELPVENLGIIYSPVLAHDVYGGTENPESFRGEDSGRYADDFAGYRASLWGDWNVLDDAG